jgi:hypothetical protein
MGIPVLWESEEKTWEKPRPKIFPSTENSGRSRLIIGANSLCLSRPGFDI